MSINDVGMLFSFIGGLGMFLYGMNIMADGLQKSAGGRMQKLMSFLTKKQADGYSRRSGDNCHYTELFRHNSHGSRLC